MPTKPRYNEMAYAARQVADQQANEELLTPELRTELYNQYQNYVNESLKNGELTTDDVRPAETNPLKRAARNYVGELKYHLNNGSLPTSPKYVFPAAAAVVAVAPTVWKVGSWALERSFLPGHLVQDATRVVGKVAPKVIANNPHAVSAVNGAAHLFNVGYAAKNIKESMPRLREAVKNFKSSPNLSTGWNLVAEATDPFVYTTHGIASVPRYLGKGLEYLSKAAKARTTSVPAVVTRTPQTQRQLPTAWKWAEAEEVPLATPTSYPNKHTKQTITLFSH